MQDAPVNSPKRFQDTLGPLKQCWINERSCQAILAYQAKLVASANRKRKRLRKRIDVDCKSAEDRFVVNIYQMQLDRLEYILRAYLRTRLLKIERFAMHILKDRDSDILRHLSKEELKFNDTVGDHMNTSFLESIPDMFKEQHEDETETTPSMVDKPDLERFVFARVLEDVGYVPIPGTTREVNLGASEVVCIRFDVVAPFVDDGRVELL